MFCLAIVAGSAKAGVTGPEYSQTVPQAALGAEYYYQAAVGWPGHRWPAAGCPGWVFSRLLHPFHAQPCAARMDARAMADKTAAESLFRQSEMSRRRRKV